MTNEPLDRQREYFCQVYTSNNLRPQAAAIECGVDPSKAAFQAAQWLEEPAVRIRCDELLKPFIRERGITRQRLVEELAKMAFYDVRRMYNEDGHLMPIWKMDSDTAAAIKSITTKGIHLVDKLSALTTLAKIWKVIDDGDKEANKGVTINLVRFSDTEPANPTESEDGSLL